METFLTLILFIFVNFISFCTAAPPRINDPLIRISRSTECVNDIKSFCSDIKLNTDVAILTCLQDSEEVMRQISVNCQHFLWEYKHNLTKSSFFDKITEEQCSTELTSISECKDTTKGLKAPCLVDHKDQIRAGNCSQFLNEIGVIIFSDYHLIYKFVDKCMTDINKYKCGRITKPGSSEMVEKEEDSEKPISETGVTFADYMTSQSHTLDCLIDKIQDIGKDCQHQILRLSELQSDDYHLNRGLYMACRDDRETLCAKVKAGEGRLYSCLMKEKFSVKMSENCRKELTRKQQVESLDAKADYPLFHNCKEDIVNNSCLKEVTNINHDVVLMSVILTCLHDAEIHGIRLHPNCKNEINERKIEMLEDFKISPEAVYACRSEINDNCKTVENEPGEVVHCLMSLAAPNLKEKKLGKLSDNCRNALLVVLKAANPIDNVMTNDAAIREACANSYSALCADIITVKESFQCLVDNLNSPMMDQKCRSKITSLLYFISLDVSIDDQLNMACHNDAVRLCKAADTFKESQNISPVQKQLEYHCMSEHFRADRIQIDLDQARGIQTAQDKLSLSPNCAQQMFHLIKAQASKIELDPSLFVPCFNDLSKFCDGQDKKGKEHECLQKNMKDLESKCRQAVIEFSKMEDIDSRLNRMLSDACLPMVNQFCSKTKPEVVLVCLTEYKFHPQMSSACHAAIEHIQITSLEEFRIDHRFASFCGHEIQTYCGKELNGDGTTDRNNKIITKATIVTCLSRTIIEKLLKGNEHPLSDECRRQFTFELLQRSESIKLDPGLVKDCGADIKKHCTKVSSKDINSCLRQNQDLLSVVCHKRLFRRERLESLDANFDGELQQKCAEMINEHCRKTPGPRLFRCLHRAMKNAVFETGCKKLIQTRLERRMNDIRLNPGLIKVCGKDIKKYCHINNLNDDTSDRNIEHGGLIIHCLKKQYANSSKSLSTDCGQRILEIIIESNTNIRLDPVLRKRCAQDMKELCKKEMTNPYEDTVNSVHNCLKHSLLRDKLKDNGCKQEVSRLLKEGKADVHVDAELFDACENAIMKLCRSEGFGDGRKMSCLLALIEDTKALPLIDTRCVKMVTERREMWAKSGNYESQSLHELFTHVTQSSMRRYLLSMLALIMAALVLLGICCGRVTKRVAVDLKNK